MLAVAGAAASFAAATAAVAVAAAASFSAAGAAVAAHSWRHGRFGSRLWTVGRALRVVAVGTVGARVSLRL